MKRILLFIDSLGSGGAQRQMVGLAKLLKDKGYKINVIYYHPIAFYKPYLDEHAIDNECVKGAANKWKRIYKIYKTIRGNRPEVVISYLESPNIVACVLKMAGLKYTLITSERNTTQNLTFSERLKFLLMRKADFIVANSYSQKVFIDGHYPHLSYKVKTITNFVDTDIFTPRIIPVEKDEKEKCNIICVARVQPQKNVLLFLDALYILKEKGYRFHVNWFGEKIEPYYSQCVTKWKNLQLENVLTFKDPTHNIVQEYQKSDVFCLPSVYEGFPNALCEAMSCGLPVLCGDVCDNPMIVRNYDNGFLFNPYELDDIIAKFEVFFSLSKDEKELMGKSSRAYAEQDFSKDSFVEKYEQTIASVVS